MPHRCSAPNCRCSYDGEDPIRRRKGSMEKIFAQS